MQSSYENIKTWIGDDYQRYIGHPHEIVPKLIQSGTEPVSILNLVYKRLRLKDEEQPLMNFFWEEQKFVTRDGILIHPESRFKPLPNAFDYIKIDPNIKLTFSDEGYPISNELYERIDYPEFTLKEVGALGIHQNIKDKALKSGLYVIITPINGEISYEQLTIEKLEAMATHRGLKKDDAINFPFYNQLVPKNTWELYVLETYKKCEKFGLEYALKHAFQFWYRYPNFVKGKETLVLRLLTIGGMSGGSGISGNNMPDYNNIFISMEPGKRPYTLEQVREARKKLKESKGLDTEQSASLEAIMNIL